MGGGPAGHVAGAVGDAAHSHDAPSRCGGRGGKRVLPGRLVPWLVQCCLHPSAHHVLAAVSSPADLPVRPTYLLAAWHLPGHPQTVAHLPLPLTVVPSPRLRPVRHRHPRPRPSRHACRRRHGSHRCVRPLHWPRPRLPLPADRLLWQPVHGHRGPARQQPQPQEALPHVLVLTSNILALTRGVLASQDGGAAAVLLRHRCCRAGAVRCRDPLAACRKGVRTCHGHGYLARRLAIASDGRRIEGTWTAHWPPTHPPTSRALVRCEPPTATPIMQASVSEVHLSNHNHCAVGVLPLCRLCFGSVARLGLVLCCGRMLAYYLAKTCGRQHCRKGGAVLVAFGWAHCCIVARQVYSLPPHPAPRIRAKTTWLSNNIVCDTAVRPAHVAVAPQAKGAAVGMCVGKGMGIVWVSGVGSWNACNCVGLVMSGDSAGTCLSMMQPQWQLSWACRTFRCVRAVFPP